MSQKPISYESTELVSDAREAYESPRLETEELFEVLALACGKVNPITHTCQTSNRNS